jgi:hypothetical protein
MEKFKNEFKLVKRASKFFSKEFENLQHDSAFKLEEKENNAEDNRLHLHRHNNTTAFREDLKEIFEFEVSELGLLNRKNSILKRLESCHSERKFSECK